MKNGVIIEERGEYEKEVFRTNFTRLKKMEESAAHYFHAANEEDDEDSKSRRLGRLFHMSVLEPERYVGAVAMWLGGRRAGKAWDSFKEQAEAEGREILNDEECQQVEKMRDSVLDHPIAGPLFDGGSAEVSVYWEAMEVPCRGRLDYVRDGVPSPMVIDLKGTRSAKPKKFSAQAWENSYHAQLSWYQNGYKAATGRNLPACIVACEFEAPHLTQVYLLSDAIMDMGMRRWSRWLEQLKTCRKDDFWPGYSNEVLDLAIPAWAKEE